MKMKFIFAMLLLSFGTGSSALAWTCNLNCDISEYIVYDKLPKHASGYDYQDFTANCTQVLKGFVTGPETNCDYVYCAAFSKRVDITSGSGLTLIEARQNARQNCLGQGPNRFYCGIGRSATPQEFSCQQ